jgi:hypothetical protein
MTIKMQAIRLPFQELSALHPAEIGCLLTKELLHRIPFDRLQQGR